jgi:hypothetical protein
LLDRHNVLRVRRRVGHHTHAMVNKIRRLETSHHGRTVSQSTVPGLGNLSELRRGGNTSRGARGTGAADEIAKFGTGMAKRCSQGRSGAFFA